MSAQPEFIGSLVDARGVKATMHGDEIVTDVVVLLRGVTGEGRPFVRSAWSDGIDWIARRGIIEVARDQEVTFPAEEEK